MALSPGGSASTRGPGGIERATDRDRHPDAERESWHLAPVPSVRVAATQCEHALAMKVGQVVERFVAHIGGQQ
jgi:hypothetical protein